MKNYSLEYCFTLFCIVATVVVIILHLNKPKVYDVELVNTAEDMIEWIKWDIEEGRVDSTTGALYIENLSTFVSQ